MLLPALCPPAAPLGASRAAPFRQLGRRPRSRIALHGRDSPTLVRPAHTVPNPACLTVGAPFGAAAGSSTGRSALSSPSRAGIAHRAEAPGLRQCFKVTLTAGPGPKPGRDVRQECHRSPAPASSEVQQGERCSSAQSLQPSPCRQRPPGCSRWASMLQGRQASNPAPPYRAVCRVIMLARPQAPRRQRRLGHAVRAGGPRQAWLATPCTGRAGAQAPYCAAEDGCMNSLPWGSNPERGQSPPPRGTQRAAKELVLVLRNVRRWNAPAMARRTAEEGAVAAATLEECEEAPISPWRSARRPRGHFLGLGRPYPHTHLVKTGKSQ